MTKYLHVHVSPWAEARIRKNYGPVNKGNLRRSLKDFPRTEFRTIATPEQPREGASITTDEARDAGFDVIEVRYNGDKDVAMITLHPSGGIVVS